MTYTIRFKIGALTAIGAAAFGIAALPVRGQQEPTSPPVPVPGSTDTEMSTTLRAIFQLLRDGNAAEAAAQLKKIDVHTLDPRDATRYRKYAADAALRTGDRAWLDQLNDDPEKPKLAVDLLLLTAMRFLQNSDYDECRALLERVREPEKLSEVPRRRYLQLYARLEQMTGHPRAERAYVAKLVDFAGHWDTPACQGCHGNYRKFGDAVTSVYLNEWWAGDRFGKLLIADGDAAKVLAAAQARLGQNPRDGSARLRVAYLQRALGRPTEAEATLRVLPWVRFPDRDYKPAMQLAPFP